MVAGNAYFTIAPYETLAELEAVFVNFLSKPV